MLILTRGLGQAIVVGDDIKVSILGIRGGQIRLGIEAPRELSVHREEIYSKIVNERIKAAIDKLSEKEGENDTSYPAA